MLQKGTIVRGKWTGKPVEVIRAIGAGANGEVYLVQFNQQLCAMKTHHVAGDIALEWGILEKLGHTTSYFPKPIIIDDCENAPLYFYLMSWIDGQSLDQMLNTRNGNRAENVMKQVIAGLCDLHKMSHAFCDVKPQNILIERNQGAWTVRFVDVGGITPFGRSVRQFTPYYDRAFWGLGARIADAHYDLCAAVLMFVCLFTPPPKNITELGDKQRTEWLNRALSAFPIQCYVVPFQMVLHKKIMSAQTFLNEIHSVSVDVNKTRRRNIIHQTNTRRARDWTERVMWISLCFAAVATLAAWASFFGWF